MIPSTVLFDIDLDPSKLSLKNITGSTYSFYVDHNPINISQLYDILSNLSSSDEVFQTIFAACYLTNQNIIKKNGNDYCLLNEKTMPKSGTRLKDWFNDSIIQTSKNASMVYDWIFSRSCSRPSLTFTETINHMITHGHIGIFPGMISLVYAEESRYTSFPKRWNGTHSIFTFHNWISAKYFGFPFGGGKYPYGSYRHPYSYWNASGSYNQVKKEHQERIKKMYNSLKKNWNWESFGKANVQKLNEIDTWNLYMPSDNQGSYQWLNAKRCFSEIMTGLTGPNMKNATNEPQIICIRPIKMPLTKKISNLALRSLKNGKCAIIKRSSSIFLVAPIGIDIGNSMTGLYEEKALSLSNYNVQCVGMYVKGINGKVSILTIFPCTYDDYDTIEYYKRKFI